MEKFLGHTVYQPLFVEMFRQALPTMEAYQSDLGHDAIALSMATKGDLYLWSVRKSGTTLATMRHKGESLAEDFRTSSIEGEIESCAHMFAWVYVTDSRLDRFADGIIIPSKVTKWEGGKQAFQDRITILQEEFESITAKIAAG